MILLLSILKYKQQNMTTITEDNNSDLLILDDNQSTDSIILEETTSIDNIKATDEDLITFDTLETTNELDVKPELNISLESDTSVNETIDLGTLEWSSDLKIGEDANFMDAFNLDDSLSLDSEIITLDEPEINSWEPSLDINEENTNIDDTLSLWTDLELNSETELISPIVEEVETITPILDEVDSSDSFDLTPSTIEETSSITEVTSVWTMIDILDDAMVRLNTRADSITSNISAEESNESNLKNQIVDLEEKVKVVNGKISDLKSEKALIVKNTKSLERMKSADVTTDLKHSTSNRVHNVKRRK